MATEPTMAKINSFGSLIGIENLCKLLAINFSSLLPLVRSLKTPVIIMIPSSDVFSYSVGGEKKLIFVGDSVSPSEVVQSRIMGCCNQPVCLDALNTHQYLF